MTSSTAHKLLVALTAAVVAVTGITLFDHLPDPVSATTRATHEPSTPEYRGSDLLDEVAHRTFADDRTTVGEVLSYWTAERMAAADPLTSMIEGTPDLGTPPLPEDEVEHHDAPHKDSEGLPWTTGGEVTRTTGKVFLTMNGHDFTCSASVVDSQNRSTLVTAGHCVKDGTGQWAQNWTFVPGHTDGHSPYGRYTARDMIVPTQWAQEADDSHDYAAVVLNTDDGTAVQDRVGAQEIAFDTWTEERVRDGVQIYTFGYPSAAPFDGRELHYCSGTTTPDTGDTTANGMRCAMTQGSSGGPWFSSFDTETGLGTISSVISFTYADDPQLQYGPRLGEQARRMFDDAERL